MAGLTRRGLERLSHAPGHDISADALGVLLTLVYARRQQPLPDRETLTKLFLAHRNVPSRLKNAIGFLDRYEGPSLLTYTAMVDFAQQAGVLRRFNPGHVNATPDLGPLEAQHLLQMAAYDFDEEIAWLGEVLSAEETNHASSDAAAA